MWINAKVTRFQEFWEIKKRRLMHCSLVERALTGRVKLEMRRRVK
jgi:hypothetical protein